MDSGDLIGLIAVILALLGLPWMIFHYITKWKSQATLTREDETLLDEMYDLARRLDDRVRTVERILAADNPHWRTLTSDPLRSEIEDGSSPVRSITR